jgi:hypothetical protein
MENETAASWGMKSFNWEKGFNPTKALLADLKEDLAYFEKMHLGRHEECHARHRIGKICRKLRAAIAALEALLMPLD